MNASSNETADNVYKATKEASSDFRRRTGNVKDYASEELRAFLADVDDLVKRVANVADADVARVRVRVANALGDIKRSAGDTADSLRERARAAADTANEYVRERPWTAIGLAAAIGVIVGVGVTAAASSRR